MPRRKKHPRKGKAKAKKQTRQMGAGNSHIQRSILGGFPLRMKARLKYVEIFSLASTTTVQYRVYGTNCLYDPYLGTGGHQPSNFDRWMQIYDFYVVLGSTATMSYFPSTTSSGTPAAFGMLKSSTGGDVATLGTATYIIEQGLATYSLVPAGIVNAPRSPLQVQKSRTADWADGADVRGMSTWWGTSSTNPGSVTYIEAWHGSLDGAATSAVTYKIELMFDCEFWGLRASTPSFAHELVRPDNWENVLRSRGMPIQESKDDEVVLVPQGMTTLPRPSVCKQS